MPKLYNPDTQETVDVSGNEVKARKAAGFITVGNRPEAEYLGKTRDELRDDDETEAPEPEAPAPEPTPETPTA